ncbi:MAG: GHKL domain-containing protein [Desulfobacteraceae bacterium]|nr:GHKL domain-containing protein [Desulfobacteraceae bacterium]
MIYKSFRINCIVRISLIIANLYLFFYLLFETKFLATTAIIGVLPVFQIFLLFNYISKTNRFLSKAFESIKYDNFSEQINTPLKDASFTELCEQLNRIVEKFQMSRMEKEQQFQYLKAIINQAGMGMISVRENGEINLINKAARLILKTPPINHISQIETLNPKFSNLLIKMKTEEKSNFEYKDKTRSVQLAVYASNIKSEGEKFKLFTFQNIQKELEEKEMDAWKKLIRVLSHEIMNSITPISSLAATANLLITKGRKMSDSDADDLAQALNTIEKRSKGLMQFVQNYRSFARIPDPNFQILPIKDLFKRINSLSQTQLKHQKIQFTVSIKPENLQVKVDPDLIEQVLLNLMSNAIEAVKETKSPEITLSAQMTDASKVKIEIIDNGCGIEKTVLPKIFIPFFSTKSEGSGVGLSLSRQIMRLHGGGIHVDSNPGVNTVSSLVF